MQNPFRAKHSAHAEPYAAELMLRQLDAEGRLTPGTRVAMVTDHNAIVVAQRRLNGYGGIGKGYSLNRLFQKTYDLRHPPRSVEVYFFYIVGDLNPADPLSRHFGEARDDDELGEHADVQLVVHREDATGVPSLVDTASPLCEAVEMEEGYYDVPRKTTIGYVFDPSGREHAFPVKGSLVPTRPVLAAGETTWESNGLLTRVVM